MITALGIGLSLGWVMPAQQPAAGPNWKDAAEADLGYTQYGACKDDKCRIDVLDKWTKAYPDNVTELWQARAEAYLGVYGSMKDNRKAFDKAKEIRTKLPNHFFAIQTILAGIYALPAPHSAADLTTAEQTAKYLLDNSSAVFAAANKPGNLSEAQWAQNKPVFESLSQRTYAWVYVQRKDDPKSEVELTKVVQAEPNQAPFVLWLGQAKFNQRAKNPAKVPEALYHVARAAQLDGPNALNATQKKTYLDFVTNTYNTYHGSKEGLEDFLAKAKANPMPASDFTIKDRNAIEMEKFKDREAWEKAHPDLAFWGDSIKAPLTGPTGAMIWNDNFKDALLPGEAIPGVTNFKGTLISMSPENQPNTLVLGVLDPATPDATLVFEDALPGMMAPGAVLEFSGTAKSYVADPFNITFEVEKKQLSGWTGVDPPGAAKGKGKAKAPSAPKGKAPPKGKGK
ncbi:MAG: hypothetical protein ABI811_12440 [Acidobacteriota bacterium]